MSEITTLTPTEVWRQFDAITRVPRPSKKEGKIIAFLEEFASRRSLACRKDSAGNILISKPASAGYEDRPAVTLQSHMDMVCEKNSDVRFDFDNDPIQAYIDGEWVRARGTTLGADCGIGMAAALAVLASDDLKHGPVSALFTVDEETGLTGAFNLGEGMIQGHYLINLDSEDEGEIFIGCAGGIDTVARFGFRREPLPAGYRTFEIRISGLRGGHSGDNIGDALGNSNKILARLLFDGIINKGVRLCGINGGNLRNAIPREAVATVAVPESAVSQFKTDSETLGSQIADEFKNTDPGLAVSFTEHAAGEAIDETTARNLIYALAGVPNGVLEMSRSVAGLVQTSTNLASVKEDGDRIVVCTSQRSSVESEKIMAARSVESVFALAGAEVSHSDSYPGWAPDPHSRLLSITEQCYFSLFDTPCKVKAIHAGLECGLFLKKYPHLEMVSFGPTLRGVHSPDERLEISTVDKFWRLLVAVLEKL